MKSIIICCLFLVSVCLSAQETTPITDEDVFINTVGLADELAPTFEKEKIKIVERLNSFRNNGGTCVVPIYISVIYNDGEGQFVMEMPFGKELTFSSPFIGSIRSVEGRWETLNINLVDHAFSLLDFYKESLMYAFFSSGKNLVSSELSEFSYSVVLQNEDAGTVTFTADNRPTGRGYYIGNEIIFEAWDGDSYIVKALNSDVNTLHDFVILPQEVNELSGVADEGVTLLKDFFRIPQIVKKENEEQKTDDEISMIRFFVNKPEEPPLDVAVQMPEFPNMKEWIASNLKYPAIAAENGLQGVVVVGFVVQKDGSLSDLKIKKSLDPTLNKEALRVVKTMTKWIPGKQDGENVAVQYSIPITFKLMEQSSSKKKK